MVDIQQVRLIAEAAGRLIMGVYGRDFAIVDKSDSSPLTEADLLAHHHIVNGLSELTPGLPILSEESASEALLQRGSWTRYWLVDPLDGTKEFIRRNGEFTVNIALVEFGEPVIGVVHAPALGVTYWGKRGCGAFKATGAGEGRRICVAETPHSGAWRVVGSRSHGSDALTNSWRGCRAPSF